MSERPSIVLVLAALVPFVPGFCQFIHRGVPDVLFTGDGATLELRTLHAARGTQLLGPYSRFKWSHPGPAFFYLALPLYEIFHRHGPALNLFVFVANFSSVLLLTFSARRLRGNMFALVVATLFAVYECEGTQFQLSGEWNPVVPIMPLGLLSFLAARLGLGAIGVLPLFVFVASAMVQTHVAFAPVVLALSALAAAPNVERWLAARRTRAPDGGARASRSPIAVSLAAATGVLVVIWLPPVIDSATRHPGNLGLLYRFFSSPKPSEHSWPVVLETVARQLAVFPLDVAQVFGLSLAPSLPILLGLGIAQLVALATALVAGVRHGDRVLAILSSIGIGEIVVACAAVRAIRGEIEPYLVIWISMIGLVSTAALAAWVVPATMRALGRRAATIGMSLGAAVAIGICARAEAGHVDVFRARDEDAERLAREIEGYLSTAGIDHPMIRIASGPAWPTAAAIVLHLYKRGFPISVERYWLFMMGTQFAAPSLDRPTLVIGDREFCALARARPDLRLIAMEGDVCAFLGDPRYLSMHRVDGKVTLISSTGVRGDPAPAVDGVVPADGTRWDSPLSVVLTSTASAIEVAVPHADGDANVNANVNVNVNVNVNGVFLSVDGSDIYAVECIKGDGRSVPIGSVLAGVPIGMGTAFLLSDELPSCRTVRVSPQRGDGYYSVGEIGFVRR